jgi:hypothetical protein
MKDLTLTCGNELRRQAVRQHRLNGLDYLEVSDDQRSLCVHFLGPVPTDLNKNNLRIEGGRRIRDIKVINVEVELPDQDDPTLDGCLRISLDKYGDFSTYTLMVVEIDSASGQVKIDDQGRPQSKVGFDVRYAQLPFGFKVSCPSDLDCQTDSTCPPPEYLEPEINYLAKDYGSFRQLILDRLSLNMPEWRERHVPDLGITLVELLAYVGDYLSYYQDAVATEAYLDTARQRISVRRHVRLVDYMMHEGCNARAWVWIEASSNTVLNPADFFLITTYSGAPAIGTILNQIDDLERVPVNQYEVFEPVSTEPIQLNLAHNEIHFYTWGDHQCCLAKGATQATLYGNLQHLSQPILAPAEAIDIEGTEDPIEVFPAESNLDLKVGDVLIFEEVKGAKTGNAADADPNHRHVVRLTKVEPSEDALYIDPVSNSAVPLVEIAWSIEDALPFSLCISALGAAPECCLIEDITVARGNVILVDHGRTVVPPENLGVVQTKATLSICEAEGQASDISIVPQPFNPHLSQSPLTFSEPLLSQSLPASKLLVQDPRQALPQVSRLVGIPAKLPVANDPQFFDANNDAQWVPQPDLLSSYSRDQHFVVEMDDQGIAHLRFGDGELGQQPAAGDRFYAKYRIGNGIAGNIGAYTISHLVLRNISMSGTTLVPRNPFPARGGTAPEPIAEVKLFATTAFRKKLQRAITAQDYADIVMRDFPLQVQRAAATLRWMGSWYEVLVAIDPRNSEEASAVLIQEIQQHLYLYRRIGHDVVVKSAVYVPLSIVMQICVLPTYLRGHVLANLLEVFSTRRLANGKLGFFHPDNLTFGGGIYLSKLIAAAQAVPGVMRVQVTRLQRLADVVDSARVSIDQESAGAALLTGLLPLESLEIARLDSDPSFPENGVLKFDLGGGR